MDDNQYLKLRKKRKQLDLLTQNGEKLTEEQKKEYLIIKRDLKRDPPTVDQLYLGVGD